MDEIEAILDDLSREVDKFQGRERQLTQATAERDARIATTIDYINELSSGLNRGEPITLGQMELMRQKLLGENQ